MFTHWSQLVPNNYVNRHPRTLNKTGRNHVVIPWDCIYRSMGKTMDLCRFMSHTVSVQCLVLVVCSAGAPECLHVSYCVSMAILFRCQTHGPISTWSDTSPSAWLTHSKQRPSTILPSHRILPCLTVSCVVWPYLVLTDGILPCLTVSCLVWPYLALSDRILPCLTVSCLVWPYLALTDRILPCLTISCLVWPY